MLQFRLYDEFSQCRGSLWSGCCWGLTSSDDDVNLHVARLVAAHFGGLRGQLMGEMRCRNFLTTTERIGDVDETGQVGVKEWFTVGRETVLYAFYPALITVDDSTRRRGLRLPQREVLRVCSKRSGCITNTSS